MPLSDRVALGFRTHSGWAAAVAATRHRGQLLILDRRRIVICDSAISGSKQPYHAAEPMDFAGAESLIRDCRESSSALAATAVGSLIADLTKRGHRVVQAAILTASGRPLPDLASILRSHALIHTAEGEFYRDVVARAAADANLPVTRIKEREIWERAATVLNLTPADLAALARTLGSPWTQDQKMASLAACLALDGRAASERA